ncbi:MAG: GNAT family N-acetyltransferase [Bacteroidetes bacterium]|nr:GNAT family N-acetyltransferase [Bacteroidota bacterium]
MYKVIKGYETNSLNIAGLFQLVWGGDITEIEEKTEWAFYKTKSKIILYEDKDRLIAARGGIFWPLQINDNLINSIQFHGTCVHPDYRRKGIFTAINKEFLQSATNDKVEFIFNVSVDASRAGYEKLGWEYIKGFRRLTLFRKPLRIIKERRKPAVILNKETPKKHISDVLIRNRNEKLREYVHVPYSDDFIKWRLDNPKAGYEILENNNGAILYKKYRKGNALEIVIGECFLTSYSYSEFSKLIESLIKKENPDMIYTYIFNNHPLYNFYLRKFFLPNPFHFNLNFGTKVLNSGLKISEEKWALSYLDIDTY